MQKLLFLAFLMSTYFTQAQSKYSIEAQEQPAGHSLGIADFYFIHHLFADAFFMTELHQQLNYDEMTEILKAVQNGLSREDKVTLLVPQETGPDARLVFYIQPQDDQADVLVLFTNFNRHSRTFDEFDGEASVVRWYYMQGEKLVYRKDLYSKKEERKKKKGEVFELIDFYLFDDNFENDAAVKPLIDKTLAGEESAVQQLYARLYLGEYWLREGDLEQAAEALEELKVYFENHNSIPPQYSLIVEMATTEYEIMKRL